MRLFYLLPLLLIATYGTVHAQTPMKREIGLRSSLGNPLNAGFIYKKQLAENRYRRYRLGFVDATVNIKSPATLSQYTAGAAIGTEFRKDLDDRLQFIHGPEVNASLSVIAVGNANTIDQYTLVTPRIGIGYVLGVQYNFNSRWYVNLETIPGLAVEAQYGYPDSSPTYTVMANINLATVGLTGAYRF
ncbi:hypothetical protein CLV58_12815 [Spirosoma oryzae]|uniref:Outer membrane protein with beta-barrel domain n=1 Tax=Spirosoma oryzae TaxID=1469603 RepID=A0A2T0S5B1_9BACT|nr:hypothetical protein [Spirosoma oryzae]PRY28600.1 hypothetical protein CLV58_12815 [Spirosoma oryzae]